MPLNSQGLWCLPRRLQIEVHLEQYQAVVQEHLHRHRHVSEHVKFPKQQYKVTVRSLQNLKEFGETMQMRASKEGSHSVCRVTLTLAARC